MKRIDIKFLIIAVLCLFGAFNTNAQKVEVQIALTPPFPSNLDAYMDRLQDGIFTVNNTTNEEIEAYFDISLTETNGLFSVSTDGVLGQSIFLQPGLTVLSPMEVQDIFSGIDISDFKPIGLSKGQQDQFVLSRQLPEGSYKLCIRVYDETQALISDPNLGCAEFEILYPERPIILVPDNKQVVDPSGFLIVQWDQLLNSVDARLRTEYQIKIIDLTEQNITNPIEAMFSPGIIAVLEEDIGQIFTTTLQDGIELPLILGHEYAIRISAMDPDGLIAYQFGGHSELAIFKYGNLEVEAPIITRPKNNETIEAKGINLAWDQESNFLDSEDKEALEYELKVLDVSKYRQGEIVSFMNSDAAPFLYKGTVNGYSKFLPLSREFPLVVGNKYAAMVELTNPDLLPDEAILASAKSSIIQFTYGDPDRDFQPELDAALANHVQGQVFWAFRESEENPERTSNDLVVTKQEDLKAPTNESSINTSKSGSTKYPLEDCEVVILGEIDWGFWFGQSFTVPIGSSRTKADGKYAVRLNDAHLGIMKSIYLEIRHRSNAFQSYRQEIILERTEFGYLMKPVVLAANSMRLSAQVLKEDYQPFDNVSINLLLNKANFDSHPFLAQTAPNNGSEIVQYNNEDYVVVKSISTADVQKDIFPNNQYFENYVIEIAVEGKPSVFYPQRSIYNAPNSAGIKPQVSMHKNLIYNIGLEISGVVHYADEPRRDVMSYVVFDDADVVGAYDKARWRYRMSDEDGNYTFNDLPNLRNGANIQLYFIDYSIRPQYFKEEITFEGESPIEHDVFLKNEIYTAHGKLVDQYGLPVKNALIKVDENRTTKSTEDGFYMIKINYPVTRNYSIVADNFKDAKISAPWAGGTAEKVDFKTDLSEEDKARTWKKDLEKNKLISEFLKDKNKSEVDAAFFGIGTNDLIDRYDTYISNTEKLLGNVAHNEVVVQSLQGLAKIEASFNGELVNATIQFEGDDFEEEGELQTGTAYKFTAPDGKIEFSITPIAGGPEFVQFFGELEMSFGKVETVKIFLQEGVSLSGVVKDIESGQLLDEAKITVEGMPYNTESDKNGKYVLYLPDNEEFTFTAKRKKYNRVDTLMLLGEEPVKHDFQMLMRDPSLPDFTKLASYPIEIDLLEPLNDGFRLSGELTLGKSDLFEADKGEGVLEFKDVIVSVDEEDEENAIPSANFPFETAELNVIAFGFAPVTVTGGEMIELRMLESDDPEVASKAVIGGVELSLQMESKPAFSAFPFSFPNATMKNAEREDYVEDQLGKLGFDVEGATPEEIAAKKESASPAANALFSELNFERVFLSPGSKIKDLSEDTEYNLTFDEPDDEGTFDHRGNRQAEKGGYEEFNVAKFAMTKLLVYKDSTTLTKDGINMEGALEMPKMIGAKFKDGRVIIDKLSIGKKFSINELTFQVAPADPLKMGIGTFEAKLTSLSLFGLGTRNVGLGFGGAVRLLKDSAKGDDANKLVINQFSIINKEEDGLTLDADLSFGPKGVEIVGMKVTQEADKSVTFSLSKESMSFELEVNNLKLEYTKSSSVAKKIFPLEIQTFKLKSKDWSLFLLLKPNISADFGIAKVRLDKFLLNIGYDMDIDEMNEMMKMSESEKEAFVGQRNGNANGLTATDAAVLRATLDKLKKQGKPLPQTHVKALANYDKYKAELSTKFQGLTQKDIDIMQAEIDKKKAAGESVPANYTKAVGDWNNRQGTALDGNLSGIGGDELLSEDRVSWAVGIAGGIEFPSLKGMSANTYASFMLSQNKDKFDFRFNELALHLEQNTFKLDIEAALSLTGEKVGFEARGRLETLNKGIDAQAKFWKYRNGGFEVGARLIVSTAITTGPITWHSMGGGFDFDFHRKKYSVELLGSAGPIGTPKQVTCVDDIKLKILFDANKCGGAPVVEGSATYKVKGQDFGAVKAKLDFCLMSAYLDISNTLEVAAGLVTVRIGGTVYIMKRGNTAAAFLGVSGRASDRLGLCKGNADFLVGVDFKPDSNTPYGIKTRFNSLPSIARSGYRFHGLFVKVSLDVPRKEGSYGLTIAGFKALTVDVSAGASAYIYAFKSFDSSTFAVRGELHADATGKLYVLGSLALGGKASVDLGMSGGYDGSWYFNANGRLEMEVWNKGGLSCGQVKFPFCESCKHSLGWPCGFFDWCTCCTVCWPYPCGIVPHFKMCSSLKFSISARQGRSTTASIGL